MNLATIGPIDSRRQAGALSHIRPVAPVAPVAASSGGHRPVGAAWLAACLACAALPGAVRAQSTVPDDAARINVWGVAVDALPQPRLVRGVSLQQSQWGDAAPPPGQAALAGAARPDPLSPAGPAVQASDVSYRWGLGTARSAVDVGVGAGAYRVRFQGAEAAVAYATSLPSMAGPSGESRRDAVVPTVSVGLRHSLSEQQRLSVYAGGSASLASASAGEFYTTQVKVEWLPTRNSSFGFEHSAVNLRFGPSGNFALRVRRGGPMIYYRSTF